MKVDRYTRFVLTIIAVGLWALVINGVIAPQPVVAAEPTEEVQLTRYDVRSAIRDCLNNAFITLNLSNNLYISGSIISGSTSGSGSLTPPIMGC